MRNIVPLQPATLDTNQFVMDKGATMMNANLKKEDLIYQNNLTNYPSLN